MKKLLKKQDGFTLVELLAVIVILAIIAAIAIPSIGHVISQSREKAEVNDALQIIDAAKLYVTDGHDTAISISRNDLAPYLSNINNSSTSYTFTTITVDPNNNTYTINGHTDPVSDDNSNSATESALQTWLKTYGG